jgi:hypothetical protein
VVPPVERDNTAVDHEYPFLGTDTQRLLYVLYFNWQLKEYCSRNGFVFFDVYNKYTDARGYLCKEKSDGSVHIKYGVHIHQFIGEHLIHKQDVSHSSRAKRCSELVSLPNGKMQAPIQRSKPNEVSDTNTCSAPGSSGRKVSRSFTTSMTPHLPSRRHPASVGGQKVVIDLGEWDGKNRPVGKCGQVQQAPMCVHREQDRARAHTKHTQSTLEAHTKHTQSTHKAHAAHISDVAQKHAQHKTTICNRAYKAQSTHTHT